MPVALAPGSASECTVYEEPPSRVIVRSEGNEALAGTASENEARKTSVDLIDISERVTRVAAQVRSPVRRGRPKPATADDATSVPLEDGLQVVAFVENRIRDAQIVRGRSSARAAMRL